MAAISRAAVRRSSDDEELAGLSISVLLLLAQYGVADLRSGDLKPLATRSVRGFNAVRDAGGVEAVVAAMRAFPRLRKNGGEFLQNLISIDPTDPDEAEALYARHEKCLYTDINAAGGEDVEAIMDALTNHDTMRDYKPTRFRTGDDEDDEDEEDDEEVPVPAWFMDAAKKALERGETPESLSNNCRQQ